VTRLALIAAVVLATLAAASVGALAWAGSSAADRLPAGASVAGVAVEGLTREQALERTSRRVGALITRPVHVQLGAVRYTMTPEQASVGFDLEDAIDRAHAAGQRGSFLRRGWRKLTGEKVASDLAVPVAVDNAAIRAFVDRIARRNAREPKNAALDLKLTRVGVKAAEPGRRLAARDALVARLTRRLTSRTDDRTIRARTIEVAAKVTEDKIFDSQPVAVTVSRSERRARFFRRGELVKTYTVAVGTAEYPTPTGEYVVQTKQVNPAWNVPKSSWAGSLAGQVIPGGDPRNPLVARWIGFNGSVGFHGTASSGSLGSAASHGCIRMAPSDVIDLYKRVDVGTPILVA
jgi:lipoprotein-anchoring transpeptidase ErfK/SrfK